MQSLAVKYRPKDWDEVCSQTSVIKILTRQIETHSIKNAYLFSGSSGVGKTTLARIFANKINGGVGIPIEIDAASNNGVDNIRDIINTASERALDAEYKVIILDEVHMLTTASWNALLKCIEEPPAYTIFMFCTTDAQKIPETIINRCQRFNLSRIPLDKIKERLAYICEKEGFTNYTDSIDYIAKLSDGCMRAAISSLDKCSSYSTDMDIKNVLAGLGNLSYQLFFPLLKYVVEGNEPRVLKGIEYFYDNGTDMRLFVEQFLSFCLDVEKFCIYKTMDVTKIPSAMENELRAATSVNNADYKYAYVVDRLLDLKNMLKNDSNPKTTVEIVILQIVRQLKEESNGTETTEGTN